MKMTIYRREGGGGIIWGNYTVVGKNGGGRGVSHRQQSIKIEMQKTDSQVTANEWGS